MTNAEHKNENKKTIAVDHYKRQNELDKERDINWLPEALRNETRSLKVALYARVAVPHNEEISTFEVQSGIFMKQIESIPNWEYAGIYKDECSGVKNPMSRKAMSEMIKACKAGKINLILTKSISRFSRNLTDCLSIIKLLGELNPPVGVLFESELLYTLDSNKKTLLTLLSTMAEEETRTKAKYGGGNHRC